MRTTERTQPPKLARRDRLLLGAAGTALLVLFATAAVLQPNAGGHGTHRQLGLPPCTFLMLCGRPCPTCGMTTAWACLTKGQWCDACRANAGGTLLGLLALAAAPWMLGSAVRGTWLLGPVRDKAIACISTAVLLVTLIQWAFRLWAG